MSTAVVPDVDPSLASSAPSARTTLRKMQRQYTRRCLLASALVLLLRTGSIAKASCLSLYGRTSWKNSGDPSMSLMSEVHLLRAWAILKTPVHSNAVYCEKQRRLGQSLETLVHSNVGGYEKQRSLLKSLEAPIGTNDYLLPITASSSASMRSIIGSLSKR